MLRTNTFLIPNLVPRARVTLIQRNPFRWIRVTRALSTRLSRFQSPQELLVLTRGVDQNKIGLWEQDLLAGVQGTLEK